MGEIILLQNPDFRDVANFDSLFGYESFATLATKELGGLAPSDGIDQKSKENPPMKLKATLPTLDENELKDILEKIAVSPAGIYQGVSLLDLLPFIDKKDIDALMLRAYQKGTSPMRCYPFASGAGLSQLVSRVLEANDEAFDLKPLLPFLSQGDLEVISKKIHANQGRFGRLNDENLLSYFSKSSRD